MQLHPSLRPVADALPVVDWMADVPASREAMRQQLTPPGADPRLVVEEHDITGGDGQPLTLRTYRPRDTSGRGAAVWTHGGAFALGGLDSEDATCRLLAADHGIAIVAPDYRLAPEHPYPAGLRDCRAALGWTAEHRRDLHVSSDLLGIGGHSAGGALALGTALHVRDHGGPRLDALYLGYPVLHDAPDTVSSRDVTDPRLWNAPQAREMWRIYLDGADADTYAAPGRATDLSGLPPTYVVVHGADPHRDEGLDLVRAAAEQDVLVEAHLVPGAPHMADVLAPDAGIIERSRAAWTSAFAEALT